jgi:hypothetical protein
MKLWLNSDRILAAAIANFLARCFFQVFRITIFANQKLDQQKG